MRQRAPRSQADLIKAIEEAGYKIDRSSRTGHPRVVRADGTFVMAISGSPRENGTSILNTWARFRRVTAEERSKAA